MIHHGMSFAFIILTILHLLVWASACPSPCVCQGGLKVNCRNTSLTSIPDGIPEDAFYLDVSRNKISDLPDEIFIQKNVLKLEELNVDWNNNLTLHPDSFKGLSKLKWLYISGNNIRDLDPDQLQHNPRIIKLALYDTEFSIPCEGPVIRSNALKHLHLVRCELFAVPPQAFTGTPNLEILDLSGNYIQTLEQDIFNDLPKLKVLYLNVNRLKVIQPQTFNYLTKIEEINLYSNKLTTLPADIARTKPRLKKVTLYDNEFVCDCRLYLVWWKFSLIGVSTDDAKCQTDESWDRFFSDNPCDLDDNLNRNIIRTSVTTERTTSGSCIFWGDEGC